MAMQADTLGQPATAGRNWYARSPEQVATDLSVDVATGGTVDINAEQFGWALVPAVLLLALWEIGKVVVRRAGHRAPA